MVDNGGINLKLKHILPELLEEERPRYAQGNNDGVAYEEQYIGIPALTSTSAPTPHPIANKKASNRKTHMHARLPPHLYLARNLSRANKLQQQG